MSEREIRATLHRVMHHLAAEAAAHGRGRRVRGAAFPLILGAGLAVTACDGDVSTNDTSSSTSTSSTSGTGGAGGSSTSGGAGGSSSTSGTGGSGAAAAGGAGGNGGSGGIGGPVEPPYMAPDV